MDGFQELHFFSIQSFFFRALVGPKVSIRVEEGNPFKLFRFAVESMSDINGKITLERSEIQLFFFTRRNFSPIFFNYNLIVCYVGDFRDSVQSFSDQSVHFNFATQLPSCLELSLPLFSQIRQVKLTFSIAHQDHSLQVPFQIINP